MRTVDLFAGCGGLSLGLGNAGIQVVAAFDNWGIASEVYRANFHHPMIVQDLSDVDESVRLIRPFKPEMIVGGPPCQDFSHAGKREEGVRADLTMSYALIVSAIQPKIFIMENVARTQKSKAFAEARKVFKKAGYGLTEVVLDASHCGVPQKRKRFFCIGFQGEKDGFLTSTFEARQYEKPLTLREYFGDKLDFDFYYRHPRTYSRRGVFSVDEPAPTIRGVNRPLPDGYKLHLGDPCDSLDGIKPLTTHQRSLIQTFPEHFRWLGSKTDQEQMIGNAVPVNLGYFVATAIQAYLKETQKRPNGQKDKRVLCSMA